VYTVLKKGNQTLNGKMKGYARYKEEDVATLLLGGGPGWFEELELESVGVGRGKENGKDADMLRGVEGLVTPSNHLWVPVETMRECCH
jgi:hypothetical protein